MYTEGQWSMSGYLLRRGLLPEPGTHQLARLAGQHTADTCPSPLLILPIPPWVFMLAWRAFYRLSHGY